MSRYTHCPIPPRAIGGLRPSDLTVLARVATPIDFTAPRYVDSVAYCIPTSNQGNEPACAGYATAGYKEIGNWITTHRQEQFDGLACYRRAKIRDNDNTDGTTLEQAAQAAIDLGWFPIGSRVQAITNKRDLTFAMHAHRAVVCGFRITAGWEYLDSQYYIDSSRHSILGGHAVLGVWYNTQGDDQGFGWQNSWGTPWGKDGFGRMSWEAFDEQFMGAVVIVGPDGRPCAAGR